MNLYALSDALLEAVLFIAFRQYDENASIEDYEEEDMQALENVKQLLSYATPEEKQLLQSAVDRALSVLPPDHERIPYYETWMDNMFEEPTENMDPPTLTLE
ncbi:MAG: hypothetical protein OHK0029_09090 [Armatimonadaceae bacterium]